MAKKLNTVNPESLIYQNELLKLTVLGGIKLDGLDRMRSTLKIALRLRSGEESSVPPVRHNLDLYNDLACEKLIRRTAEKLEIGTSVIAVNPMSSQATNALFFAHFTILSNLVVLS